MPTASDQLREAALRVIQLALVGERIEELEQEWKNGGQSDKYWCRQQLKYLQIPGYIRVEIHKRVKGTPPPGHVWIQPSAQMRNGPCRKDKKGRKLTMEEMEELLAKRQAEHDATGDQAGAVGSDGEGDD